MATITWLHLSDLHFRAGEQWDEDVVLRNLLKDVRQRIAEDGLRPDLVAVSGDVAFCGAAEEYVLAGQFFDELLGATEPALPKDRLLVVPGNHDVDRRAITRGAEAIVSSLDSRQAVNEVLATAEDRRLVFRKFAAYAGFAGLLRGPPGL